MKIIVGLGNPDTQYENTFHNLGFMCVDKAVNSLNLNFNKTKFRASIVETKIRGEKVVFVKPLTYMNLSGESVSEVVKFYKASLNDLLVVYDDFDLKKGTIRLRESGSAGTHNGMKNIISMLGSELFPRIRVGFKSDDQSKIPLINLVLSGIKAEDKEIFEGAIELSSIAIIDFANGERFSNIMQKYNTSKSSK